MSAPCPAAAGVLLCDDLLFASRILGTAQDLGLLMTVVRDVAALEALVRNRPPSCIVIDLGQRVLDLPAVLARIGQLIPHRPRIVAYGSHVDVDGLRAAREAGCDIVLPRSKFVEELPRALREWMQPPELS